MSTRYALPDGIPAGVPTTEEVEACFEALAALHPEAEQVICICLYGQKASRPPEICHLDAAPEHPTGLNAVVVILGQPDWLQHFPAESLAGRSVRAETLPNERARTLQLMRMIAGAEPQDAVCITPRYVFELSGGTWNRMPPPEPVQGEQP